MISPKLAVLMAAFAVVGITALPGTVYAAGNGNNGGDTNEQSVEIERNNEIEQSIEQEQEACTNEAEVEQSDNDYVDIGGDNSVDVSQSNKCLVVQSQSAENNAAIADFSDNFISVEQILADIF